MSIILRIVGQIEYKSRQPFFERQIVLELLKQIYIVCHGREDDLLQSTLTFGTRFLLIRILHGILILLIFKSHLRDGQNLTLRIIRIISVDVYKHIVEVHDDFGKQIHSLPSMLLKVYQRLFRLGLYIRYKYP